MTAMRFLTVLLVLMGSFRQAHAAAVIQNLQVEYRNTPLSIDVARPRFSWQMATTAGERGHAQTAYQIQVKDTRGNVVCDTRRIETTTSLGIQYAGRPLEAATRYTWTVSVWNQPGAKLAAGSWFETGLMDPSPDATAWGGAKWIGGGDGDLVLHAPYLAIFDLSYALTIAPGSTRASFVYGANDSRLMDQNKNVYQLQNGRDRATSSWNSTSPAWMGHRRARRSCTFIASATRTPIRPQSRFALSRWGPMSSTPPTNTPSM